MLSEALETNSSLTELNLSGAYGGNNRKEEVLHGVRHTHRQHYKGRCNKAYEGSAEE